MPEINVHPIVLLTGAGFTHNFGGYLATQMWEHIFNCREIFESPRVQALMKNKTYEFNYEKVYAILREGGGPDFDAYLSALRKVYGDLDGIVRRSLAQHEHGVSLVGVRRWLGRRFNGLGNRPKVKGFIFTLNQDLFLERNSKDGFEFWIPGLPSDAQAHPVQNSHRIHPVQLGSAINAEGIRAQLHDMNVVKLHGSCNWVSADGKGIMVLGEGKAGAISAEPLLNSYLTLFEEVLFRPGIQLWVVGYGFGDSHINSRIAKAIRDYKLKLCIIDFCRPNAFFERLKLLKVDTAIQDGISAFVANSLEGVFPKDRWSESTPLEEMEGIMATAAKMRSLQ